MVVLICMHHSPFQADYFASILSVPYLPQNLFSAFSDSHEMVEFHILDKRTELIIIYWSKELSALYNNIRNYMPLSATTSEHIF